MTHSPLGVKSKLFNCSFKNIFPEIHSEGLKPFIHVHSGFFFSCLILGTQEEFAAKKCSFSPVTDSSRKRLQNLQFHFYPHGFVEGDGMKMLSTAWNPVPAAGFLCVTGPVLCSVYGKSEDGNEFNDAIRQLFLSFNVLMDRPLEEAVKIKVSRISRKK